MVRSHMRRVLATAIVGSAILSYSVASAKSSEVWLADLDVTLTAVEDRAAGQITHVITVTNIHDDTGRDIVITHIPVIGVQVLSFKPKKPTCVCALKTYNTGVQACSALSRSLQPTEASSRSPWSRATRRTGPGARSPQHKPWGQCRISTAAITRRVWNCPEASRQRIPRAPHKAGGGEPGWPERRMTCRAYNGDTAVDDVLPNTPWFAQDKVRLEDEVARNTGYLIAKAMLAEL